MKSQADERDMKYMKGRVIGGIKRGDLELLWDWNFTPLHSAGGVHISKNFSIPELFVAAMYNDSKSPYNDTLANSVYSDLVLFF